MFADEFIAEVRDRTDIVGLIGEYVELKQRGANFVGLCPFHSEKTPSFNVRRDRQFYHCFGCQESGDALAFVMRLEGLTFPQAARSLAQRAGLPIPETDERESAEQERERIQQERLLAINEEATAFYVKQRAEHPARAFAQRALDGRNIQEATSSAFRLGYAPPGWESLASHLQRKGHSLRDAEQLGLVLRRREGNGYYDRFRHRLLFPITDLHGRVVAFSGRLLDPIEPARENSAAAREIPEPKYVNSPESPVYHKGALLFGLHQARVEIRRNGWAVLCEGNFDLVALHQAGFRNAVAPLGTAFTEAQAKLLRRFAQRVTLLFDADPAGRKAVQAAYSLLRKAELAARVATLPEGSDPDSFLREQGAAALTRLVDGASGIVEYLIDAAAGRAGPAAADRASAIAALGPVVAAVGNPVEIELYIERIAQRFSISELRVVKEQLRQGVRSAASASAGSKRRDERAGARSGAVRDRERSDPSGSTTKVASAQERVKLPQLQSELLGALLDRPVLFRSEYAENLKELLTVADLRAIFTAAADHVADRGTLDAPRLLATLAGKLDDLALAWLQERLSVETYSDDAQAEQVLRRGIPFLAKQNIERELPRLAQRISLARQRGDESEAITLTRQRHELAMHAHQLVKGVKR